MEFRENLLQHQKENPEQRLGERQYFPPLSHYTAFLWIKKS